MKYIFDTTEKFDKELKKLSHDAQKQVWKYIRNNINLENPRSIGKPLKGTRKGEWRYQTGNYRIICEIQDKKLIVLGLEVGHRQGVYRD